MQRGSYLVTRVFLLWGPNGGVVTVCGVFSDHETARKRATESNRAEGTDPDGYSPWFVEEWIVQ
jgi:hypothetical protein